jgi:hypothetical protein
VFRRDSRAPGRRKCACRALNDTHPLNR